MLEFNRLTVLRLDPGQITLADRRRFFDRYPKEPLARLWYKVRLIDVPTLSPGLSVYPGGTVHVPFQDLHHWFWQRSVQTHRAAVTKFLQSANMKNTPLFKQRLLINSYIQTATVSSNRPPGDGSVVNIEELPKVLPPCMRNLISDAADHFPRDAERCAITSSFQKAGLPVEMIEQRLEILNDRFPKNPVPQTLGQRWDVRKHYNKEYGAPTCEKLDKCMKCPYGKDKTKCLAEFHRLWPNMAREDHIDHFYGPYSWPKWVVFYRNRNQNL